MKRLTALVFPLAFTASLLFAGPPAQLEQQPNTWVLRSPVKGGPPSPGMGYEASFGYDPRARLLIRWAGHNQGGGGEQNAETWTFDPATAKWALKEPNLSPPGVCCAQQNVFDLDQNRFLRFQAFSGSHGWQWFREIYLNNSTVWSYDLTRNTWRDLRTVPAPRINALRCASWDSDHQVAVVFGGENNSEGTVVFDPYVNTWTRMKPARQPAFRSAGNMVYDAARKRHILFGSQFTDDPHTWAYDLQKNEWHDLKPALQPPGNRNDAVLAYDSNSQMMIASVRVVDKFDGKEIRSGHFATWAYDGSLNTWKPMKPPAEPPGWGNRRRIMTFIPDQNVALMEDFVDSSERIGGRQQIWTYRYAKAKPSSVPPASVTVTTTANAANLSWKPATSIEIKGYAILRADGAQPWLGDYREIGRLPATATSYRDDNLKPATTYYYRVRSVTASGQEVALSPAVRAQPRVVEDLVVSVLGPREIRLAWPAPAQADIAGYHVERTLVEVLSEDQVVRLRKDTPPLAEPSVGAIRAIGPFTRITQTPLTKASFTDNSVDLRKPAAIEGTPIWVHRFAATQIDLKGKPYRFAVYAYRVRALNKLGVAGGDAPYALTIPSSPQWLFSREEKTSCRLKWAANPEAGVKGYRIYRMESPRINGPGQPVTRVTAEPVAKNRYTDSNAGSVTRRYWVVALDGLGQEGFPSAPAWHYRQYRRFYEPFVGEWHQ